MYKIKTAAAAVALAAMFALSGCTVFHWGGPTASSPKPQPQAEDLFKKGEELLEKGKYEEARQTYSKVKETDPEKLYDALVQIRLGDSYYEESRYAEAEVEYKRFLELHPANKAAAYVKYQLGMCNFKQMGRADRDPNFATEATRNFSELLKNYPNSPYTDEAREKLKIAKGKVAEHEYSVGMYYYKGGFYRAAANRFKGIIENYPNSSVEPEVLYMLADSYIRLDNMEDAKTVLSILYQEYPNNEYAEKAKSGLAGKIEKK
jgi:outer membrane protein assembly factor BamD